MPVIIRCAVCGKPVGEAETPCRIPDGEEIPIVQDGWVTIEGDFYPRAAVHTECRARWYEMHPEYRPVTVRGDLCMKEFTITCSGTFTSEAALLIELDDNSVPGVKTWGP